MYATIDGPEPDDFEIWEEYVYEAYENYKDKKCTCANQDECECLSFERFREEMLDDLESCRQGDYEDWEDYA